MKFEIDKTTGIMKLSDKGRIAFNMSQGGGIIVDDTKHNVRYILERNGSVTKLSGSFVTLNLYDLRECSIILERVRRIFGKDSKFNNIKIFLKNHTEGNL